jgi:hypothetical protein
MQYGGNVLLANDILKHCPKMKGLFLTLKEVGVDIPYAFDDKSDELVLATEGGGKRSTSPTPKGKKKSPAPPHAVSILCALPESLSLTNLFLSAVGVSHTYLVSRSPAINQQQYVRAKRSEASAKESPKETSAAEAGYVGGWRGHERSERSKGVSFCGGSGLRSERAKRLLSAAEAGSLKRAALLEGCRGENPRPNPRAGEVAQHARCCTLAPDHPQLTLPPCSLRSPARFSRPLARSQVRRRR